MKQFVWIGEHFFNSATTHYGIQVQGGIDVWVGNGYVPLRGSEAEQFIRHFKNPEHAIDMDRVAALDRERVA